MTSQGLLSFLPFHGERAVRARKVLVPPRGSPPPAGALLREVPPEERASRRYPSLSTFTSPPTKFLRFTASGASEASTGLASQDASRESVSRRAENSTVYLGNLARALQSGDILRCLSKLLDESLRHRWSTYFASDRDISSASCLLKWVKPRYPCCVSILLRKPEFSP